MLNYYACLDVGLKASYRNIYERFYVEALRTYPSSKSDSHGPFIKVCEAFFMLSDEKRRKAYDAYLEESALGTIDLKSVLMERLRISAKEYGFELLEYNSFDALKNALKNDLYKKYKSVAISDRLSFDHLKVERKDKKKGGYLTRFWKWILKGYFRPNP